MEREIDMKEVSDGRLYGLRDMVKADCGGCAGCGGRPSASSPRTPAPPWTR